MDSFSIYDEVFDLHLVECSILQVLGRYCLWVFQNAMTDCELHLLNLNTKGPEREKDMPSKYEGSI